MNTNRRRFCFALGGFAAANACHGTSSLRASGGRVRTYQQTAEAFGTTVRLLVSHESELIAQQAMRRAFREVELIESLMSLYRQDSQLSRLNRATELQGPHPYLVQVISAAHRFHVQTNLAFDITVQPLWELYQHHRGRGQIPEYDEVRHASRRIGHGNIDLTSAAIKLRHGARITLNGIAQGFATDQITRTLRDCGIDNALIDVGELAGVGVKSDGGPWRAGIQHPREKDKFASVTPLDNRCLATSGDYATTFTKDFRLHHIFDPRTGKSPEELASVSVLAPTAIEADALSTALVVLGIERGARLLSSRNNVDAMFIDKEGRTVATRGFPGSMKP